MTAQRHARILHWDDERRDGNSLIVTLKPSWAFAPHADERLAEHVRGFDAVKEAMQAIRQARPCACARCKTEASR